jgi:hypothetical protein
MKIALITIHYANSYGGVLQALATQQVLSKYGEVSIIDFRTQYIENSMKVFRSCKVLHIGKDIFRVLPRYR